MKPDGDDMNSTKKQARYAGWLYVLVAITAPIGLVYVPGKVIVPGDAAATANHLRTSASLLRIGIGSELLHQIIGIFVVLALYRLFKAVNEKQAALMVILRALVSVPIVFLNVLNEIAALILVGGANFLSVFQRFQLDAVAYLFSVCTGRAFRSPQSSGGCGCFRSGCWSFDRVSSRACLASC